MKFLPTLLVLSVLSAATLLNGCSVLGGISGSDKPVTTFVLSPEFSKADKLTGQTPLPYALVLAPVRSNSFDNREFLVFAKQDNTRGTYQYAQWSEKPSRRLDELIFSTLEHSNVYQTLAPLSADVVAQHLLVSELLEFYHDATNSPGLVTIKMRFSVYDQTQHALLARQTFTTQHGLDQFNAQGAAKAFNVAVGQQLYQLTKWLGDWQPKSN
ncbi:ABC-type transport auxiliary lipoprotein family protein [Thiomicrorhabdus aquaedulcis]|uniref:ABC-type transport auxiliary lipoprotein family protein n=1 Tax=Thiomicrorhabdus aquaedulcis TaxID=2211106 RepID=UPI000FD783A2|nr:ABC-type transport auxiliary lipoprotein family protein [Thiomicrorhabdus aquaedulcis]